MIASFCNPVRGLEILRSMNCMSFSLLRCRMYASLEMDRNLLKIQLVNGGGGGAGTRDFSFGRRNSGMAWYYNYSGRMLQYLQELHVQEIAMRSTNSMVISMRLPLESGKRLKRMANRHGCTPS